MPAWILYVGRIDAEDFLDLFFLIDDWMYERPSNVYFMGSDINIMAYVKQN